ncbi:SIS domain-containing protein [bacterium]|nr:SIS domain-containing protein [bacterium]
MDSVLENILQQPFVFDTLIRKHLDGDSLALRLAGMELSRFENVIFTGMGTSLFSAYPACLYLMDRGCRTVQWLDASELLHYGMASITSRTLLIMISQSGESFEIVRITQVLQARGISPTIVGITMTDQNSALHDRADIALAVSDSSETSLGAFKSYTGSLVLLLLLAKRLIDPKPEPDKDRERLSDLARKMSAYFACWQSFLQDESRRMPHSIYCIGRGPAFSASLTGALLTIELAKSNACALSGGQFRHGPIEAAADPENLFMVSAPTGRTHEPLLRLAGELAEAAARVMLFTNAATESGLSVVRMPELDEYFSPALYVVPLQLFSYYLALSRGLKPGAAKFISKVTRSE